jgi:hypothetical protein
MRERDRAPFNPEQSDPEQFNPEPFDIVLLDVNGTLVPSLPGGRPDPLSLRRFRSLVDRLTGMGVAVGLCSDSPLEQLWEFGGDIGLGEAPGFPVVAENGNVAALDGAVRILTPFPARRSIRAGVAKAAAEHRLRRVGDVTAPEFGGSPPASGQWAFGANRRASVSVFGAPDFIDAVQQEVTGWSADNGVPVSVEVSPDRSCAGIHPYARAELGKRTALAQLASREPKRILLVGNSPADWVPDVDSVRCAFVADPVVPGYVRDAAWYASQKAELEGVIDILGHVIRRQTPLPGAARP